MPASKGNDRLERARVERRRARGAGTGSLSAVQHAASEARRGVVEFGVSRRCRKAAGDLGAVWDACGPGRAVRVVQSGSRSVVRCQAERDVDLGRGGGGLLCGRFVGRLVTVLFWNSRCPSPDAQNVEVPVVVSSLQSPVKHAEGRRAGRQLQLIQAPEERQKNEVGFPEAVSGVWMAGGSGGRQVHETGQRVWMFWPRCSLRSGLAGAWSTSSSPSADWCGRMTRASSRVAGLDCTLVTVTRSNTLSPGQVCT